MRNPRRQSWNVDTFPVTPPPPNDPSAFLLNTSDGPLDLGPQYVSYFRLVRDLLGAQFSLKQANQILRHENLPSLLLPEEAHTLEAIMAAGLESKLESYKEVVGIEESSRPKNRGAAPVTEVAIRTSFRADFEDASDIILPSITRQISHLYKMCESGQVQAPLTFLVQASGTGKSRMIYELAKSIPTVYVCLRPALASGYPKRTSGVADQFLRVMIDAAPKSDDARAFVCLTFCLSLFRTVADIAESIARSNSLSTNRLKLLFEVQAMPESAPSTLRRDLTLRLAKNMDENEFRICDVDQIYSLLDMIALAQARIVNACKKPPRRLDPKDTPFGMPKLLFVLDEISEFYKAGVFFDLRRAFKEMDSASGILGVGLDTDSKLSNYLPHFDDDKSARGIKTKPPLPPVIHYPSLGVVRLPVIKDASSLMSALPADHIFHALQLVEAGRPMFSAFFKASCKNVRSVRGIIRALERTMDLAHTRLLGKAGLPEPSLEMLIVQAMALICPRLGIKLSPLVKSFSVSLTAEHLALLAFVSADRQHMLVDYLHEPLLIVALTQLWYLKHDSNGVMVLGALKLFVKQFITGRLVGAGMHGEVLSRLLLLMGRDAAAYEAQKAWIRWRLSLSESGSPACIEDVTFFGLLDKIPPELRSFSCSESNTAFYRGAVMFRLNPPNVTLRRYLRALGVEAEEALGLIDPILEHRVTMLYWHSIDRDATPADLDDAIARQYGIIGKSNQKGVDLIIPLAPPLDPVTLIPMPGRVSAMFIQVKNQNEMRPGAELQALVGAHPCHYGFDQKMFGAPTKDKKSYKAILVESDDEDAVDRSNGDCDDGGELASKKKGADKGTLFERPTRSAASVRQSRLKSADVSVPIIPAATGQAASGTAAGGTAAGGTAAGDKAVGGKAVGGTAAGGTAVGGKAVGGTAAGGTAVGGKAVGGTAAGGKAAGGKAAGGKAAGGKAAGGKAAGGKAAGGKAAGGKAAGGKAAGGTAAGDKAAGGKAAGDKAPCGEDAGGKAAGGKAAGGKAAGGKAAGGKAAGGKATGGTAAGGKAVGGKAVGDKAVGDKAPGGEDAGGTAAGGKAAGGKAELSIGLRRSKRTFSEAELYTDPLVPKELPAIAKPDQEESGTLPAHDASESDLPPMPFVTMVLSLHQGGLLLRRRREIELFRPKVGGHLGIIMLPPFTKLLANLAALGVDQSGLAKFVSTFPSTESVSDALLDYPTESVPGDKFYLYTKRIKAMIEHYFNFSAQTASVLLSPYGIDQSKLPLMEKYVDDDDDDDDDDDAVYERLSPESL